MVCTEYENASGYIIRNENGKYEAHWKDKELEPDITIQFDLMYKALNYLFTTR